MDFAAIGIVAAAVVVVVELCARPEDTFLVA